MPPFDGSSMAVAADTPVNHDLSAAALEIVCRQLESPAMQELWALHRHSRAQENIPAKIAADIREHRENMDSRPDLQAFAAEFLLAGLRASRKDSELAEEHAALAAMYNAVPHAENIGTYKARHELPEDCKQVLDMLDIQFRQRPFSHFLRDMGAEYAEHLKGSAKKHPVAFGSVLAVSLGAGAFMKTSLGPTRAYIDPAYAKGGIDPLTGEWQSTAVSAETIEAGLKFSCHNHLAPIIGENAAQVVGDTLGSFGINHCSGFMDLGIRAQGALQASYDFVKIPFNAVMDTFARNPLADFGSQVFLDSRFVTAYNAAATSVADAVYAFNTVENVVLHSFIFAAAAVEGFRQSAPGGGHEAKETLTAAKDFIYRTLHDRPLTYALPVATAGATWAAQGNFDSTVVLAGAAAGAAGHIAHNLKSKWDKTAHIKNVTQSAGDLLQEFTKTAKEKGIPEAFIEPARKPWLSAKQKMSWAGASFSAYATIVFADASGYAQTLGNELVSEGLLKSSEVLGAATATGLIAGLFVPYNIIEDAAQHIGFGLAGYGAGRAVGAVLPSKDDNTPRGPG